MAKVVLEARPAPVPVDFMPPKVEQGQTVLWSYQGASNASPAIVLSVGTRTLNLAVHVDGLHDHMVKTGVRHAADPFLRTAPQHDAGVWVRTPRDMRIDALLDRFGGEEEEG